MATLSAFYRALADQIPTDLVDVPIVEGTNALIGKNNVQTTGDVRQFERVRKQGYRQKTADIPSIFMNVQRSSAGDSLLTATQVKKN